MSYLGNGFSATMVHLSTITGRFEKQKKSFKSEASASLEIP